MTVSETRLFTCPSLVAAGAGWGRAGGSDAHVHQAFRAEGASILALWSLAFPASQSGLAVMVEVFFSSPHAPTALAA